MLGRSNREYEQLAESKEMGADHVAFGAIYATTSKGVARNPQGPERVREAKAIAGNTPLVAIGGINLGNVAPVVEAGADAICVTAAVGSAERAGSGGSPDDGGHRNRSGGSCLMPSRYSADLS